MRWTSCLSLTLWTLAVAAPAATASADEPPAAALLAVVTSMTLHDGASYVEQRDAVVALGPEAVAGLRQLAAETPQWRVAAAAEAAAGWIEHGELYGRFEAAEPRQTRGMTLSYAQFADQTATLLPLLIERLTWTEDEPGRRMALIGLLRRAGDPRATSALGHALTHDEIQGVRSSAAAALERSDDPAATTALIEALASEPEVLVRRAIAGSLGWRKDAAAVQPLVDMMTSDDDATCRAAAAQALGWIAEPAATDPLIAALTGDDNHHVRGQAALALGHMGGDTAAGALRQAIDTETDAEVIRLAEVALSQDLNPLAATVDPRHGTPPRVPTARQGTASSYHAGTIGFLITFTEQAPAISGRIPVPRVSLTEF